MPPSALSARRPSDETAARAAALSLDYEGLPTALALAAAIERDFSGRLAVVSSFGAESAVLLHMISEIAPETPVLFGETLMHFEETLAYRAALTERLGLTEVRDLRPEPADLAAADPDGALHRRAPDSCCHIRKVLPLETALAGFDVWVTGRKRHQAATRAAIELFEADDKAPAASGRLKMNPLYDWSAEQVAAYIERHDLPRHPLLAEGFPSIGCAPCTSRVAPGEDPRAGRWRGFDKTECGIHFENGRLTRAPVAAAHRPPFD